MTVYKLILNSIPEGEIQIRYPNPFPRGGPDSKLDCPSNSVIQYRIVHHGWKIDMGIVRQVNKSAGWHHEPLVIGSSGGELYFAGAHR